MWNKLLLMRYSDLGKVLSEGSHSSYNALLGREFWKYDELGGAQNTYLAAHLLGEVQILVTNGTSMLNQQMPSTFQKKCPASHTVFMKSIMILGEKRDLASTSLGYKQCLERV